MGLLEDAIRDHLELKRRRGADPAELLRQEREAFGSEEELVAQPQLEDQSGPELDHAASPPEEVPEEHEELPATETIELAISRAEEEPPLEVPSDAEHTPVDDPEAPEPPAAEGAGREKRRRLLRLADRRGRKDRR